MSYSMRAKRFSGSFGSAKKKALAATRWGWNSGPVPYANVP